MKKFTNKNVQKEKKRMLRTIFIGILCLALAIGCKYWEDSIVKKTNKNITDFNSIIMSSGEKENRKAYLNVQSIPYKFAVYDDTTNAYYIVSDDKYLYIIYMSVGDYNKLNREDIYDTPIRVEGITNITTEDVKKLAIDVYNEEMDDEKDKLTISDFDNYFGSIYLNMTVADSSVAWLPMALFMLFLILGEIVLLIGFVELFKYSRSIKKLDDLKIQELDNEMNDQDAFYYEKARLYLTRQYVINFAGTFKAIRYEDILWMYPFEQRTNGIKTSQSIKILTTLGKTYTIANIDIITKKKKEIYNEIWNTIASKNDKMKLGYTKENIKEMNMKIKEIKKKNKN